VWVPLGTTNTYGVGADRGSEAVGAVNVHAHII
jgi:hypothetical protein